MAMKVKVLKDAMLTVTAGQIVEISEKQFALAEKLGLVAPYKEEKPAKAKK